MDRVEGSEFVNRSVAAMIALGVGDAAGNLGRDESIRRRHGLVTELLPEGKSTDDTEFTVLSACALIRGKDNYSAKNVADSWRALVLADGGALDRGGEPLYGALANLARGLDPPLSGMDNVGANDDGAAMRAVPFAVVSGGDPADAARLAAIDASVSHCRDGVWAAQAIAASVAAALTGASVESVIERGQSEVPSDSWLGRRLKDALAIVEHNPDLYDAYRLLHTRLWTPRHSMAAEAIPQAYALFKLCRGDFKKGLVLAANFGRDADTICALVLALCAAGQGPGVIPQRWCDQVRHPAGVCLRFARDHDLVSLAQQLSRLRVRVSE